MDPGLLDMLEDAGDRDLLAVADRVDVDLDRVAQIAVDQHRRCARHLHRGGDIMVELLGPVDDLHRPPAEHVGRPQQHRIADPLGDRDRLVAAAGDAVGGLLQAQLVDQLGEALAVLGQVDAVGRGAEDRDARRLQLGGELERGLPAELDDHARPARPSPPRGGGSRARPRRSAARNRAGRSVGVGRDRLRIAVDHDRLEARPPSARRRRGSSNSRTRSPARCGWARRRG